jgi:hypothetical protein
LIVHEGLIGAFNYAVGPALIYESPATLNLIHTTGDPYVVIVPDTIPLKALFSCDTRRVRGFVLARCEKDSVFTGFVITQRRAAVRCVPGILEDIQEGRIKNGDLIAVDGVNGQVYVQPDQETIEMFESLRATGAPDITKEHLPRFAREAMQTANIPEIPDMPPTPPMPEMLHKDTWAVAPGPDLLPHDMPTPADIKREIELTIGVAKDTHALAKLKVWQTIALVQIALFRDKPLEPDELEVQQQAVAEELARLEALKPPPPEPEPKTGLAKWGLTPREEDAQVEAPPRRIGGSRRRRGEEAEVAADEGAVATAEEPAAEEPAAEEPAAEVDPTEESAPAPEAQADESAVPAESEDTQEP